MRIKHEPVEPKTRGDYSEVYRQIAKLSIGKSLVIDNAPNGHHSLYINVKNHLQKNRMIDDYNIGIRNKKVFIERI